MSGFWCYVDCGLGFDCGVGFADNLGCFGIGLVCGVCDCGYLGLGFVFWGFCVNLLVVFGGFVNCGSWTVSCLFFGLNGLICCDFISVCVGGCFNFACLLLFNVL